MSELEERLGALLNNPQLMQQIASMAQTMDGRNLFEKKEEYLAGSLAPVFFGSALTNFGVETFLQHFLQMTNH